MTDLLKDSLITALQKQVAFLAKENHALHTIIGKARKILDKPYEETIANNTTQQSLRDEVCSNPDKLAHEIHSDVFAGEAEIAEAIRIGFLIREVRLNAYLESIYRGGPGIAPDWVYEARRYRQECE